MKYYLVVYGCRNNKSGEIINYQLHNQIKDNDKYIVPEGTELYETKIANMFFIIDKEDKTSEIGVSIFYMNKISDLIIANKRNGNFLDIEIYVKEVYSVFPVLNS